MTFFIAEKAVSIAMAMGSLYDWTKIVTSRDPLTQMRYDHINPRGDDIDH